MYRPDYKATVALLSKSLASRDIQIPPFEALLDAFVNYFEDNDMYLAASIMGSVNTIRDWHFIELGRKEHYIGSFDLLSASESMQSAVGAVIDDIDDTHIYPTEIRASENVLEFLRHGELMYRIGKIQFSEVNPKLAERVRSQFKGIRRSGDNARVVKRLNSIQNFAHFASKDEPPRGPGGRSMIAMVDNYPIFLRAMLFDRFSIAIKQSAALEIAAEMFGAKSWNVFKAAADKLACDNKPMYLEFKHTRPHSYLFYKNSFEGLVGFNQALSAYPGRDILSVDFCSGSSDAIYVTAYNPENDVRHKIFVQHTIEISLSSLDVLQVSDTYIHLSWVNGLDFASVAKRLSEMLLGDGTLISRLYATRERTQEDTLIIGNYLFTKIYYLDGKDQIKVEMIDPKKMDIDTNTKALHVEVHKSILATINEGTLLLGDHGGQKEAFFEGLTDTDTTRLSQFSGIQINQQAFYMRRQSDD